MYVVVTGGGKVGRNVTRSLLAMGHEVTLIEQRRSRFQTLEEELGPVVVLGDATEIHVLERAGIARPPDLVVAATGDDEDNLVIAQIAREGYGVPKVIARVNDPRNQELFDLLGVTQTMCATTGLLGLVEHEVPAHGPIRYVELKREGLEVIEMEIREGSLAAGRRVASLPLPGDARVVAVISGGRAEIADDDTVVRQGDQLVVILRPDVEEAARRALGG